MSSETERISVASLEIQRAFCQERNYLVDAIKRTAAEMRKHYDTWGQNLCMELEKATQAHVRLGWPVSFVRVAGQSHLEKPLNRLLAWLVTPDEDHGLGAAFLVRLARCMQLETLVRDIENDTKDEKLEIFAETYFPEIDCDKQPDLLVRTTHAAMMLENKVDSPQSGDQYPLYFQYFQEFAGNRERKAYLCSRHHDREKPKNWDGVIWHEQMADMLFEIAKEEGSRISMWSRVGAIMCAVALADLQGPHERFLQAQAILQEAKSRPITPGLLHRMQDLLPFPKPPSFFKEVDL